MYAVRRLCSDFMDMLRRLISWRIIIIIIIIIKVGHERNKGYNTVWSELCECIRANSLQTVL